MGENARPPDLNGRARRRQLALLYIGQLCVWATIFLSVIYGALAIRQMTGTFALGGMPVAMYSLSSLVVIYPAGRLMDRIGRAPVLALGHVFGAAGAAIVAVSLHSLGAGLASGAGFLAGLFLLSAGSSVALLTRVAVADLYPPERRARGVGRVVVISFAGSGLGAALLAVAEASGGLDIPTAYLAMVPFFIAGAAAMAAIGRGPSRAAPSGTRPASVRTLLRKPEIRWTITSNAGAQAAMGGVMSLASPILSPIGHMMTGGVMLSHFGGMFLPSPVAGSFADRRGRAPALLVGGGVLVVGASLFVFSDFPQLAALGLFLVGFGWCFTFIPGTAILADASTVEERGGLFGTNDAAVSIVGGAATLLAGFAYASWGVFGLAVLAGGLALLPIIAGLRLRPPPTVSAAASKQEA